MSIPTRNTNELLALTGIRGIAATGVLLAHVNVDLEDWKMMGKYLYAQPYVDLFFILSGFVISYVYMAKAAWTKTFLYKFYSARFARIYPLHLFTLAVAAAIFLSGVLTLDNLPNAVGPRGLIKQLLLMNAMPVVTAAKVLVFTSWSVSIEWWLYIFLFPVLFTFKNVRKHLASPVIILLVMIGLVLYLHNLSGDVRFTRSWPAWIRGLSGFTVGWLIHYHYIQGTKFAAWCQKYCSLLVVSWILIILILPQFTLVQPWIALILSPFLLMGLCYNTSAASNFLSTKPVVFLGDISYSIYLLHPIVLIVLRNIFPSLHLSNTLTIIIFPIFGIGLTLGISSLSYKYLEKPARDWINSKLNRKKIVINKVAVGAG